VPQEKFARRGRRPLQPKSHAPNGPRRFELESPTQTLSKILYVEVLRASLSDALRMTVLCFDFEMRDRAYSQERMKQVRAFNGLAEGPFGRMAFPGGRPEGRRYGLAANWAALFRNTSSTSRSRYFPFKITAWIFWVLWMSSSGLASSMTRSAR
jgi:hypothetical protein